jgi:type IV secretory pathway TraG/TraD family ATPase VirD4
MSNSPRHLHFMRSLGRCRQRVRLPSPPDSKLLPKYVSPGRLTIICAFLPNRIETAEHLSKLTGQTTVVREQLTRSDHGWSPHISRTTQEISRPLLTADEAMRMKGPNKDRNGFITGAGHMVVSVAGYPAIHGIQPLYFKDPELLRRAQIPADSAQRMEVRIA